MRYDQRRCYPTGLIVLVPDLLRRAVDRDRYFHIARELVSPGLQFPQDLSSVSVLDDLSRLPSQHRGLVPVDPANGRDVPGGGEDQSLPARAGARSPVRTR
jgi:hypothetical protein